MMFTEIDFLDHIGKATNNGIEAAEYVPPPDWLEARDLMPRLC